MSAVEELVGGDRDNRSDQEIMLGLLQVLVDSQAKQAEIAESHAITLHRMATTQHQMMELLRSTTKNDEKKHKVVENASLPCLNQPESLSTLAAPEKHIAGSSSDHATDNLAVNMNLPSGSVYGEEITRVIPSDFFDRDLQPFEHRQQLQLTDLTGPQTITDLEIQSDEQGDQVVNKFVLDGYERLYRAAIYGDWDLANEFLEENPEAITQAITTELHTVLHLAVFNMVDLMFVEEIVKLTPPKVLENKTADGFTALHFAGLYGYTKAAEVIVTKNPKTTQILSASERIPLEEAIRAVTAGQKETVEYLYSVTRHEHPGPFSSHRGASLLYKTIDAGFNNIALSIVQRFPRLVTERTKEDNICGLELMAERPFAFRSGAKLTFWQRCIYSFIQVNISTYDHDTQAKDGTHHSNRSKDTKSSLEMLFESSEGTNGDEENPMERFEGSHTDGGNPSYNSENSEGEGDSATPSESSNVSINNQGKLIKFIPAYLMPSIKQVPCFKRIYEQLCVEKMMHKQAYELIKCMLIQLDKRMNRQEVIAFFAASSAMKMAIQQGTVEFVEECIKTFSYLIWDDMAGKSMLQMAIAERNEMIVDLICEASDDEKSDLVSRSDKKGNTILHYAAKLAPSDQLNSTSGAYLQMQRELQWFKGVENMMLEKNKFKRNRDGDTAQHIFTEKHKELMEKGEKLLKDTSGSCMVVAALIATVAFAAAFTAPGGNISDNNSTKNGTPVFLNETSFTVFAVADATALFSSVTSVLMFLAIYTSRYAESDFLKSLPQKLIAGLVTLFISMATILVAFGASLYIVLGHRFSWAAIPIALFSCVPLTLFASWQLPLFFEMVRSTYWNSPLQKHRYIPNQQFNAKKDN
ncbi:hypothetical protein MKX03_037121 [Papaver bracteatum]|nr:hypothetical protein MKX03_037121 [Papaver bracteatum]